MRPSVVISAHSMRDEVHKCENPQEIHSDQVAVSMASTVLLPCCSLDGQYSSASLLQSRWPVQFCCRVNFKTEIFEPSAQFSEQFWTECLMA